MRLFGLIFSSFSFYYDFFLFMPWSRMLSSTLHQIQSFYLSIFDLERCLDLYYFLLLCVSLHNPQFCITSLLLFLSIAKPDKERFAIFLHLSNKPLSRYLHLSGENESECCHGGSTFYAIKQITSNYAEEFSLMNFFSQILSTLAQEVFLQTLF